MNKIKYKLNKEWLNELLKHKTDSNVYFSLSDNDIRILLTYIDVLQSKIDKVNEILEEILVVSDWEHEGRFRPVKGTTAQDVYKTIVKLNELLETPRKINYELLKEDK